ncbi:MAG TPA: type II toxin-antitoxin system RelE/ParE family toxin [Gemmataceae bacterium]|nr:type II toxin-antitoxin system RelE/ParE family toxin [Gemmataceae bacterium]
MAFAILFTKSAVAELGELRKFDQRRLRDAIAEQLTAQPLQETRNRKQLRPNELAEWELHVAEYRVFYDVDETEEWVKVVAIGYKEGNKLFIHGKEFKL